MLRPSRPSPTRVGLVASLRMLARWMPLAAGLSACGSGESAAQAEEWANGYDCTCLCKYSCPYGMDLLSGPDTFELTWQCTGEFYKESDPHRVGEVFETSAYCDCGANYGACTHTAGGTCAGITISGNP